MLFFERNGMRGEWTSLANHQLQGTDIRVVDKYIVNK